MKNYKKMFRISTLDQSSTLSRQQLWLKCTITFLRLGTTLILAVPFISTSIFVDVECCIYKFLHIKFPRFRVDLMVHLLTHLFINDPVRDETRH